MAFGDYFHILSLFVMLCRSPFTLNRIRKIGASIISTRFYCGLAVKFTIGALMMDVGLWGMLDK